MNTTRYCHKAPSQAMTEFMARREKQGAKKAIKGLVICLGICTIFWIIVLSIIYF